MAASITTFADPGGTASTSGPFRITTGTDGNLWYTSSANDRIGRITPAGVITTFADPAGSSSTDNPYDITTGPDGNIWYTTGGNRIGRLEPGNIDITASITTFGDPDFELSSPSGLTVAPDGNL